MNSVQFMQNEEALQRLGNWYMGAFWLALAAFYFTLVQEGYQPQIALVACCAAAFASILHRRVIRFQDQRLNRALADTFLPIAMFLVRVSEVIEAARSSSASVGLMLISFKGTDEGGDGQVPEPVVRSIREHVEVAANIPVFQLDSNTLAIVERDEDVAAKLERLSEELQSLFRAQRLTSRELLYARQTVGIAVSGKSVRSGAELLATARVAVELSEAGTREIFVRRV